MNQYGLQRYFKTLCKSFEVAKQEERLAEEEEIKYVEKEYVVATEAANILLHQLIVEESDKKLLFMEIDREFWKYEISEIQNKLRVVMKEIQENKFSYIITKKEEIDAIRASFEWPEQLEINLDEEYLKSFPQDAESQRFLIWYRSKFEK